MTLLTWCLDEKTENSLFWESRRGAGVLMVMIKSAIPQCKEACTISGRDGLIDSLETMDSFRGSGGLNV